MTDHKNLEYVKSIKRFNTQQGKSFSVDQLDKTDALSSNCEGPHTSVKPEASIP